MHARRDVPRKAGDGCRTRRVSNSDRTPAPEARNQVVPTHFIKEETEIPGVQTVWLTSASPLFPPLQDARGARFVHSASRVPSRALAATFRARRRASRTRRTHAHDPCAESRTPDTTAGTPSVNNPPSSHRCPRLSRARRRTPETTTTSLSRRGAHDGWHTPSPPPPPIRVRVPPTRTSPDRCARPPSTRLSGRKKYPFTILAGIRQRRLGPKLPRIPAGSVRPGI